MPVDDWAFVLSRRKEQHTIEQVVYGRACKRYLCACTIGFLVDDDFYTVAKQCSDGEPSTSCARRLALSGAPTEIHG